MVDETRASLLIRIRDPEDSRAWEEFHELYAPLLYRYARARGLSHDDAEDVRSTCYEIIVAKIRDFDYDRDKGGFKAWLRTVVNRRVVDLFRKRREGSAPSRELRAVPGSEPSPEEIWEQQWKEQHLRFCIQQVRGEVSEKSFQVFDLLVDRGLGVPEVCERLELSRDQVYQIKSRFLARVRAAMAAIYSDVAR